MPLFASFAGHAAVIFGNPEAVCPAISVGISLGIFSSDSAGAGCFSCFKSGFMNDVKELGGGFLFGCELGHEIFQCDFFHFVDLDEAFECFRFLYSCHGEVVQ